MKTGKTKVKSIADRVEPSHAVSAAAILCQADPPTIDQLKMVRHALIRQLAEVEEKIGELTFGCG